MRRVLRSVPLARSILLALCLGLLAAPAGAAALDVDFDEDNDPGTIRSSIQAELGELVVAYVVVNDIPEGYPFLAAMQFGIDATSGLDLVGMRSMTERGAMLNDGIAGLAFAFGNEPFDQQDLPLFVIRLVFQVLSEETQSVQLTPSMGWDHPFQHIIFHVMDWNGNYRSLEIDPGDVAGPRALVNPALPIRDTSWGAIKHLFQDDTI